MAHKTLIGGTAYEIKGGKTLVGGTAYSIKSGKTLVGGTAYEVGFGDPPVTITLNSTLCKGQKFTIDGNTYNSNSGTPVIAVPVGSVMQFDLTPAKCDDCKDTEGYSYVYVNNSLVHTGRSSSFYSYTVMGNITISTKQQKNNCKECEGQYTREYLYITET